MCSGTLQEDADIPQDPPEFADLDGPLQTSDQYLPLLAVVSSLFLP